MEYDRTLYANDYRGWHQFVLTSYTSTGTVPTYSKDFSDFSDNEWWTICEPFPLTAKELKQVFGDEVKLVKLIGMTDDYNGTNSSKRMSLEFFLEEDNGTVTGIDAIRSDSQDLYNDDIYNISGQLVRRKGDMSNLTKGLYIVNGKKYIVK